MSATAARVLAREALCRVREREAYAHETMSALLDDSGLSDRDRAFTSRLAFGAIACRGTLDEALLRHIADPARVEARVMDALAVAAYEILFMRTPARAAVNEGVELVRDVQPKAAGLANAVLRRLAERAGEFPWGDPVTDDEALARLHGHPVWLTRLLVSELGRESAESVMRANNEPAPLYVGLMPFRLSEEEVLAELAADDADPRPEGPEGCVRCGNSVAVVRGAPLARGDVIVADGAAQTAAACVPLRADSSVIDIGAGRGTKTLLLSARAARAGINVALRAVDSHAFKLERLTQVVQRVGAPNVTTVSADATDRTSLGLPAASADAVLVDAPCSGLGTLRRHPDRRWRARAEELEPLAELGAALLRTAAFLVKPGGFVVYSTCTIVARENDGVVDGFLASEEGTQFIADRLDGCVPPEWQRFLTPSGRFLSLPEPGGPDGHYIARIVRQDRSE